MNKRETQRRIAYAAARILTEYRIDNYLYASRKAAAKLGITNRHLLPDRQEIEQALREQQWLIRGDQQQDALQKLRSSALQAMRSLEIFDPLLVGPVYWGTADSNSTIELHLFAETSEEVILTLSELHIPWQQQQHPVRFSNGENTIVPGFYFSAGDTRFKLLVFPAGERHRKPLDTLDNQPVKGATLNQLAALLT